VRILLDTAIPVRGHGNSKGLARDLLIGIVESDPILLLSNAMLFGLAKVLRYPHMLELHGLSDERIYDYVVFLREAAEIVAPNPLLITPIRDVNDAVLIRTALMGEADVLCTRDFFEPPAEAFLRKAGITVMDDIALIRRLSC
jgi:putative PIN family toxin of toxin-antitoxin system